MSMSRFFIDRPIFAAVISLFITIVGAIAYNGLSDVISRLAEEACEEIPDREKLRRLTCELMQRHKATGFQAIGRLD